MLDPVLKGLEISLPDGIEFCDTDAVVRNNIHIKLLNNPRNMTYKSICVEPFESLPDLIVDQYNGKSDDFYSISDKIVLFVHNWLRGSPSFVQKNSNCLDYSTAKSGYLVAYRLDEETDLNSNNFFFV